MGSKSRTTNKEKVTSKGRGRKEKDCANEIVQSFVALKVITLRETSFGIRGW